LTLLAHTVGLTKGYASGGCAVRALSDVSISIAQGEYVAISGRSGSGKSTLMCLLGLLDRPDFGSYAFGGRDVSALTETERAAVRNREIGFVFQLPALLPRASAQQNVELPLIYSGMRHAERERRAIKALDRVGLSHRRAHCPNQLSGGEQQRTAIARAIVNNPTLILADEPTGALDSKTSDEIISLFGELNMEGRAIVVVTHAADVAKRARRQITLHDGRVVADDANSLDSFRLTVVNSERPR
jgi:putative ABC transport system ATP-binding protein